MTGSTENYNPRRLQKTLDLRSFDSVIENELARRIPFSLGETRSIYFMPAIYQRLANELSYYKGTFYCKQRYDTKAFRKAYQHEDQEEIIDELGCELSMRLCALLGVTRLQYGVRIEFITHNQWLINYIEEH